MASPFISVVVPCYNLEKYIGSCLESILNQSLDEDFEVLVCNDGSHDSSLDIISALGAEHPRLKVLNNDRNMGLLRTMKRLLQEAKGEYIAYMDGDDLALPGKLQCLANGAKENPAASILYHEVEVFDDASGAVTSHYCRDFYNSKYIRAESSASDLLRYGIFFQASSGMVKSNKRFDEILEHGCKIILDYPFYLGSALCNGGSILRVPGLLGAYRIHSSSFGALTLRSTSRRHSVTDDLLMAADHALTFGADPLDVVKSKVHTLFSAALYFLKRGQNEEFRNYIALSRDLSESSGYYFDERHRFLCGGSVSQVAIEDNRDFIFNGARL